MFRYVGFDCCWVFCGYCCWKFGGHFERRISRFGRKGGSCFLGKKMVVLREGDPPKYGKFCFLTRSLFINLNNFVGFEIERYPMYLK